MAAFVRDWRGGECVAVRALTLAAASAQLEGVATSAQPFESVNEAFKAKFGFEPEIGGWLIGPPQCAVTQFLAKARLDPAAAPRLELGAANLRSGQHLTGLVEAPPGRQIEVWQISDAGEASNITALVRSAARSFNLRIERAGSGGGSKPQIIIAFASAQPLTALRLARPAPAEKALPAVLAESQTRNLPLGVTIRVFNVE
jgi:serine/threonine-protein kinase